MSRILSFIKGCMWLVFWASLIASIVVFIFPTIMEKGEPTQHPKLTAEQVKKENLSARTKEWEQSLQQLIADEQTFFIENVSHKKADLAIDAKKIIDYAEAVSASGITSEVLQKFIRKENYNWNLILKDSAKIVSPEWGKLQQRHDHVMNEANNLAIQMEEIK